MSVGPCQGAGRYAVQCGRRVREMFTTPDGHTFGLCHLHVDQEDVEATLIDVAAAELAERGDPLSTYMWRRWPTAMLAAEQSAEAS